MKEYLKSERFYFNPAICTIDIRLLQSVVDLPFLPWERRLEIVLYGSWRCHQEPQANLVVSVFATKSMLIRLLLDTVQGG
jgi:hypothetical protein